MAFGVAITLGDPFVLNPFENTSPRTFLRARSPPPVTPPSTLYTLSSLRRDIFISMQFTHVNGDSQCSLARSQYALGTTCTLIKSIDNRKRSSLLVGRIALRPTNTAHVSPSLVHTSSATEPTRVSTCTRKTSKELNCIHQDIACFQTAVGKRIILSLSCL